MMSEQDDSIPTMIITWVFELKIKNINLKIIILIIFFLIL